MNKDHGYTGAATITCVIYIIYNMRDTARNDFQQYSMLTMSKRANRLRKLPAESTANVQQGTRYNKIPGWPLGWLLLPFACLLFVLSVPVC